MIEDTLMGFTVWMAVEERVREVGIEIVRRPTASQMHVQDATTLEDHGILQLRRRRKRRKDLV